MENFDSIALLIQRIMSDKQTNIFNCNRYPVRFIFLPSLESLKELESYIKQLGIELVDLSNFIPNDDGWFTTDGFVDIIKNLEHEKDFIIFPFSEVLRFFSDDSFIRIVTSLIEYENVVNNNRRIYVPLIGIHERFNSLIIDKIPRIASNEWVPIWKVNTSEELKKLKLYITDFKIKLLKDSKIIKNSFEWLNTWKSDISSVMFTYSKTLSQFYQNTLPDQVFDIYKIKNIKDYINELLNLYIPIDYSDNDIEYWNELSINIGQTNLKSFQELILNIFNRLTLEKEDIVELWLENSSKYKKWLLKAYVLNFFDNSYLNLILEPLKNFEDINFINKIWFEIFNIDKPNKDWINERKKYLLLLEKRNYSKTDIELKLESIITSCDINKIKSYITGLTDSEKKFIIKNFNKLPDFKELIKQIYLELDYYVADNGLDTLEENKKWLAEYFKEYKISKINNQKSQALDKILFQYNHDKTTFYKWFCSFKHYQEIIGLQKVDKIVWVDGLGIEWLSLIVNIIENNGCYVENAYVSRVNLPTTTECNRFTMDNLFVIKELDEYIHRKRSYDYPEDLINEIKIIKKIVEDYLIANNNKIMLISDHGVTAFASSEFGNSKRYDFEEAHHEGRVARVKTKFCDDEDFFFVEDESDKNTNIGSVVALKHISLSNTPRRETHGGATPEEVLIPILIISKNISEHYEVSPINLEVTLAHPVIKLNIEPVPRTTPKLLLSNKTFDLNYDENYKKWVANIIGIKSGKHEFIVKIGSSKSIIKINLKGGMTERNLI